MFTASPEQPLTPASSSAGGGLASLSTEPSLSPRGYHGGRAVASFPSPKHARTGSTDSGGLAFLPSPGPSPPSIGHASSPTSPLFVFSASKTSAPLVRGRKKRPRRQHGIVSTLCGSLRQWDVPQQAIGPPQKVVKTYALVTAGETSRSSIRSGSSTRPCCTFFTSPVKATPANCETSRNEEARKASTSTSEASARLRHAGRAPRSSIAGEAFVSWEGEQAAFGGGSIQRCWRESHSHTSRASSLHRRRSGGARDLRLWCPQGVLL
ncbi:hypothetical protein ZWY2020_014113 [Hordeum vulgare]|nr:hypothetical protein ZWY2020_014113 [Hordeum vulgare]